MKYQPLPQALIHLVGWFAACLYAGDNPVAWSFSSGQSPVYHLRAIRQQPHVKAVVTSSIDGTTACFTPEGKPLWTAKGAGGFPYDMAAADIDGDGLDDRTVATAGFGRDRVDLSGPWRFVIDPLRRGEQNGWQLPACDIQKWVDVEVPHCWNVDPRFPFRGMARYRRTFSLPPEATKQHAILRFGGVFYRAKFWLNGLHPL